MIIRLLKEVFVMTGRFKKFVSIIISLMVVCSAFGLYASAGNTTHNPFNFALAPSETFKLTDPVRKLNDSSVFVKLNGGAAEFTVWGTNFSSGTEYGFDVTLNRLSLYEGEYGYIQQLVYENGFPYAMLGVRNTIGYTRSVYGYWTADSY